jgi:hypothetical protein
MTSENVIRVKEEDDPERCQGKGPGGQCWNRRVEGSDFCIYHSGGKTQSNIERQKVRNYRLAKFQNRFERHVTSPEIKSLRDEVAILRMSLEERLNQCKDEADLILQSGPIGDMIMKIDKVVLSCHKIETHMGQYLDKQALIHFASEVVAIISDEINDEVVVNHIADRILQSLNKDEEDD